MSGPEDGLPAGAVIAERYRVVGSIGGGSMGTVHEVEEIGSGRRAAMKSLRPEGQQDRELVLRLAREGKAMSLLEHPNIVELLDVVRSGDAVFVVTELVRGVSLRDVIADGQVEPRRALAIVRQVLEALGHAHARGVVHRDIKPENIMLVDGGHPERDTDLVKVLDFGVAKLLDDTRALLGESKLTRTGHELFGSPLYVAPEPVLGRPVDARTDLYSVGVVLFELLAGRPPFEDPDPLALLRLQATAKAPTLAERAPERPFTRELEYVVAEALAKKPELRFASAAEMITALDVAARSLEPAPVPPVPQPAPVPPAPQVPQLAPDASTLTGPAAAPTAPDASTLTGPAAAPDAPTVTEAPAAPASGAPAPASSLRARRWAAGVTVASVIALAAVATALRSGRAPATVPSVGSPTAAVFSSAPPPPAAAAAAAPRDAAPFLAAADESERRGRHLDALAAYERALALDPALARDAQLRAKLAKILETRDVAAGIVALELLASRVDPPAREQIAAQASAGTVRELRWRAFAIAERDGYGDRIDRLESWSKDLRQATNCDDRRSAIARLRGLADRRAIAALRNARDRFPCIEREAAEAITQLQSGPEPTTAHGGS